MRTNTTDASIRRGHVSGAPDLMAIDWRIRRGDQMKRHSGHTLLFECTTSPHIFFALVCLPAQFVSLVSHETNTYTHTLTHFKRTN